MLDTIHSNYGAHSLEQHDKSAVEKVSSQMADIDLGAFSSANSFEYFEEFCENLMADGITGINVKYSDLHSGSTGIRKVFETLVKAAKKEGMKVYISLDQKPSNETLQNIESDVTHYHLDGVAIDSQQEKKQDLRSFQEKLHAFFASKGIRKCHIINY
ncbi:MAG: hypothetical protein SP1CHLAM54_14410 [Chlamydiia bacterium]|nr:hypothetical protein [Chlamydiia bacterium]MCH9616333.1 hypothetical protein [Chlamydiia bacterium]MCH9629681.1 hypothetical protein [Chlamydiia bacterium]